MELKIEKAFGIREKLVFKTDKQNMVIFAPNGIGKTSMTKSFRAIKNGYVKTYIGEEFVGAILSGDSWTHSYEENVINNRIGIIDNIASTSIFIEDNFINELLKYNGMANYDEIKKPIIKLMDGLTYQNDFESFSIDERIKLYEEYAASDLPVNKKIKYINAIEKINELKNIGIKSENKNIKTKEFKEIFNEQKRLKTVMDSKISDYEILNLIENKDRKEHFNYAEDKTNFIEIDVAINKIRNEISGKHNKNVADFISKTIDINNELNDSKLPEYLSKGSTTLNSLNNYIQKMKKDLKEKISKIEIIELEEKYKELEKFNTNSTKLKNSINLYIKNVNNFFDKSVLEWKVKIKEINNINERLSISYFGLGNSFDTENEFLEFASEGEKRILITIVLMCINKVNNDVVILDDVVSSLDNHHIDEFLKVYSDNFFDDSNFIILTHNFELLRSMAFIKKITDNSEVYMMDKTMIIDKKEIFKLNPKWTNITNALNFEMINTVSNPIIKFSLLSNILRENIQKYFISKRIPPKGHSKSMTRERNELFKNSSASEKQLINMVEFFDAFARHYKRNVSNDKLKEKFYKTFVNMKDIPIIIALENAINNFSDEYMEFIKEYNDNNSEIEYKDFNHYICNKVMMGLSFRFKIEWKSYYKDNDKDKIDKWESDDRWGCAGKLNGNSYKTNFLSHVNNLEWLKIIEIPVFKILKLIEK